MTDSASASFPESGNFPAIPVPLGGPLKPAARGVEEMRFNLLWTEAREPTRRFLVSFLADRSVVDDCLQEVALLAWRKGLSTATREQFKAFSLECAKRLAMAEVRRKYRTRERFLAFENFTALVERSSELELLDPSGPRARMTALRSCLDKLGGPARHLLELRYTPGQPDALKEESSRSGSSLDAIYKKLERLRGVLKDCVTAKLRQDGDER